MSFYVFCYAAGLMSRSGATKTESIVQLLLKPTEFKPVICCIVNFIIIEFLIFRVEEVCLSAVKIIFGDCVGICGSRKFLPIIPVTI